MKIDHPEVHLSFEIENCSFHTLRIGHYFLENSVPAHSHGANTYEIHYIISGNGKVKLGNEYYDLKQNTFYVNGPQVVHSHISLPDSPICEYTILIEMDASKSKTSDKHVPSIMQLMKEHPF